MSDYETIIGVKVANFLASFKNTHQEDDYNDVFHGK